MAKFAAKPANRNGFSPSRFEPGRVSSESTPVADVPSLRLDSNLQVIGITEVTMMDFSF
jgi:hypothetical protein